MNHTSKNRKKYIKNISSNFPIFKNNDLIASLQSTPLEHTLKDRSNIFNRTIRKNGD